MIRRIIEATTLVGVVALLVTALPARADDATRVYNAPVDRVWTVTRSVLTSLGWDLDKEDREVGWIVTDSRRLEGENYGVYFKGTRHRLRLVVKGQDAGRTAVTIERRVFRQERILFVNKEEDILTSDRTVEKQILDAIAKSL